MIPLYKVYMPDDLSELNKILFSSKLAYGEWGKKFEKSVSNFIDNDKFLAVNSYNSAMLVAIVSLGLKPGDRVIASPMSCLASNQPFVTQNLEVVWADIDPDTGTLNPEDVKKRITKKTKAIFHNHHCGYVGYVEEINKIARDNGILVVDDAIEAFGSNFNNKKMGNIGADITVFSFQTVRLPNTIEGGGLAFNDSILYERAKLIRDYGIERASFRDCQGEISKDCDIALPGFGATLNDISGYIGYLQMEKIIPLLIKQRNNAERWEKLLNKFDYLKPLEITYKSKPNYWILGVLSINKMETISFFREKGFFASGVHLPNNCYSVFKKSKELKGVKEFYDRFLALPSGWWINEINF